MSLLQEYAPQLAAAPVVEEQSDANGFGTLLELFETISEEAFIVGDVNNWLQRKAAKISTTVRDNLRALTNFNFKRPDVINVQPLARSLNTRDYTDLVGLNVYVPVGFQNELLGYATTLTSVSQPLASGALIDVLLPAQKCFGYYINNTGEANETRELICKPKITLADITKVIEAESAYFIAGNHRSSAPLGDVFENKNAIVTTADMLNKINHSLWQQVPPEKVQAEVEKLSKLSTVLLGLLENNSDNTSAVFVKSLVGQLVEVGRFIEWYAVLMTRLGDFTAAMKLNEKNLIDLQQ
ncbi:hypothetical protein D3C81_551960 [compost metagenome]